MLGHYRHLGITQNLLIIELNRTLQIDHDQAATMCHRQFNSLAGVQTHIPHIHRRKGFGRTRLLSIRPGDQTQLTGLIGQCDLRDFGIQNRLIAGRRELVRGRQIDPKLDHFQLAAILTKRLGMKFLMHDAATCGHPLHIARPDHATATGGITMRDFAAVDNRDGFKAAMRMLANASFRLPCLELSGARIVQQQKRA